MKIRQSFVSNSSSCSFIIVGSELRHREVHSQGKELISQGRLYASTGEYGEGENFFKMTKKMLELYWKHGASINAFFDVQHMLCEGGTIKKRDIKGEEFHVFPLKVSNHSISTLEEFKQFVDMS